MKRFVYSRELGERITDELKNVQVLFSIFHHVQKGCVCVWESYITKRKEIFERCSLIQHKSGQVYCINLCSRGLKPSSFQQYQGDPIQKPLEKACENTVFTLFILHWQHHFLLQLVCAINGDLYVPLTKVSTEKAFFVLYLFSFSLLPLDLELVLQNSTHVANGSALPQCGGKDRAG